jgi:8-oxo-dGTP pyrophosphatase MutT (NUDIX family)
MTVRLDAQQRRNAALNLGALRRHEIALDGRRRAAVALVIGADDRGEACFLLTRRPASMRRHAGQWALPGGKAEPGESAFDTARRETREEVGLALDSGHALGALDDYATRSGYVITPVVFWYGERMELELDRREVAAAFEVPVADLGRDEVPRLRRIPESARPVISVSLPSVNSDVHAPTAAILYQLWEVVFAGRTTRVHHFEQPVFAWR